MSLRERTRPRLGIIEPCLPSPAKAPPSGSGWLHEINNDGFRILARRDSAGVRLYSVTRRSRKFMRIYIVVIGNNLGGWLWSDLDFLTIGEINGWRQNDLITFFDT